MFEVKKKEFYGKIIFYIPPTLSFQEIKNLIKVIESNYGGNDFKIEGPNDSEMSKFLSTSLVSLQTFCFRSEKREIAEKIIEEVEKLLHVVGVTDLIIQIIEMKLKKLGD